MTGAGKFRYVALWFPCTPVSIKCQMIHVWKRECLALSCLACKETKEPRTAIDLLGWSVTCANLFPQQLYSIYSCRMHSLAPSSLRMSALLMHFVYLPKQALTPRALIHPANAPLWWAKETKKKKKIPAAEFLSLCWEKFFTVVVYWRQNLLMSWLLNMVEEETLRLAFYIPDI